MNEPRCQVGEPQCRNQAAGTFIVGVHRWTVCEDDWLSICDQVHWEVSDPLAAFMDGDMGWEPLTPDPARAATDRRLAALAAGAFG